MNRIRFSPFLYVGFLLFLAACQAVEPSLPGRKLGPGDTIAGMRLATGAKEAPPLWAFCSPAQQEGNIITCKCELPVLPSLAIGNLPFLVIEGAADVEWAAAGRDLSINDQPVDLEAFGRYRYATPAIPGKPSLLPEVFKEYTAWDIVLTDLTPGEHTLSSAAQAETLWVIQLTIRGSR